MKIKILVFLLSIFMGVMLIFFSKIRVCIAGTNFSFPRRYIVGAPYLINYKLLDSSSGVFVQIPGGPYYGKWGFLLQSSYDIKGTGNPMADIAENSHGDRIGCISEMDFEIDAHTGWFYCKKKSLVRGWYFRKIPGKSENIYSINTAICQDDGVCSLNFSFKSIDVEVPIRFEKLKNASKIVEDANAILGKYLD